MTDKSDKAKAEKFSFIFGSFSQTAPNLRSPDSDIDIISNNMDECEVRFLLRKKYPNLPKNIKVDIIPVDVKNNKIKHAQCYWQDYEPIELYNRANDCMTENITSMGTRLLAKFGFCRTKTKYTFDQKERNFACCVRDPKKQSLIDYLKSPLIDLTKRRNLSHVINKHYGSENFTEVISTTLPNDEHQIIKKLYETEWELTPQCSKLLSSKFVIDTLNKTIIGEDVTMFYSDFASKCIKKEK
jgi:hypothetical protein